MRLLLPLLLSLSTGCSQQVQADLDEDQANQIAAVLGEAGIDSRKSRGGGRDGRWSVVVAEDVVAAALRVMRDNDLPRRRPAGFGEVYERRGMVPSPSEDQAMFIHALSGELARTLASLEGVESARVHLVVRPNGSPSGPRVPLRPRASVLLKARSGRSGDVMSRRSEVQSLVAGSIDDLDPDAISVMVSEFPPIAPSPAGSRPPARNGWRIAAGVTAGIVVALSAMLAFVSRHITRLRLNRTGRAPQAPSPLSSRTQPLAHNVR